MKIRNELLGIILRQYVDTRKQINIKDLKGKISFSQDYDYKAMRK